MNPPVADVGLWTALFTGLASLAALITAVLTRAMVRPLLVVEKVFAAQGPGEMHKTLYVRVKNAGSGAATLRWARLRVQTDHESATPYTMELSENDLGQTVVAPGWRTVIQFRHSREPFWETEPLKVSMHASVRWSALWLPGIRELRLRIWRASGPAYRLVHSQHTGPTPVYDPPLEWRPPGYVKPSRLEPDDEN